MPAEVLTLSAVLALGLGYLLGSVPFGLLLTRAAGLGDIRTIGSGNIGATNVLRTGNKALAAATLLLDGLKGTAAVLIGAAFGPWLSLVAGFGAFLGHLFPVWLGFRGGKGVATFLGVLAGLHWPSFLLFAAVWLTMAFAFRFSSLAALVASLAVPVGMLAFGVGGPVILATLAMVALLWLRHRQNIANLLAGTESRIGSKSTTPPR